MDFTTTEILQTQLQAVNANAKNIWPWAISPTMSFLAVVKAAYQHHYTSTTGGNYKV